MSLTQEVNQKNKERYREISCLEQGAVFLEEVVQKEFGFMKPDDENLKKEIIKCPKIQL